jgi:hypothetical protein
LDVDPTAVAGTWFRHVPAGADVHLRPPHPADNRWQRGDVVDALYFADSEETVWAEWYRFLAEAGLPPRQGLPRDLWRWNIALPEVADLGDEGRLERVGLPPLKPTRRQWPDFQAVGEQLFADGWPALVSASAARPAGRTLCVFRTAKRVAGTWPVRPPTTVSATPVVPRGLRT